MTLEEIKQAVDEGKTVHWKNDGYVVTKNGNDYYITFRRNQSTIGLTWQDGVTLNGEERDFYEPGQAQDLR